MAAGGPAGREPEIEVVEDGFWTVADLEDGPEPSVGETDLPLDGLANADRRLVEVAVDAVGSGGGRTYTYSLPPALAEVAPGEAVLVDFGRRQALAIVLRAWNEPPGARQAADGGFEVRPVRARVRADGPLLPPLALDLARWISAEYLAPPATVLRAMLPPGLLERLELVVELLPAVTAPTGAADGVLDQDGRILAALANGPASARDLPAPEGRPALLRRLHALARRGLVQLEWTLVAAAGGPRYERWLTITESGAAALAGTPAGARSSRLGPRQLAALSELADAEAAGLAGPPLADRHGTSAVAGLLRRGLAEAEIRERPRLPLAARPVGARGSRPAGAELSPAQAHAVASIREALEARDPTPLLLEGVTGGGKTAVYVEAAATCLAAGRPVLLLVPEIPLAVPIVDRLRADLGARVALVHSGLGAGERLDEWRRIRAGEVDVVVGTRLAVLAPLADVGLVVVDEEHEAAYKSDRTPRLQARDTAIRLAELAGAACVLGSATPAVETVGRVRLGRYRRLALPSRPSGALPVVELVDLRAELAAGNRGFLSRRLAEALAELDPAAGERAILMINRRGAASVVVCRDCGHVQACPECTRPLVFHQAGGTLRCHHCGTASPLPGRCPACRSPRIRHLGGGTERVEAEVRERFPDLRVGRLDRDVTERKGAATRLLDAFAEGRLDVLVGTSLVAKGLDVPEVTLVGVVSADIALNLPDERAAERTEQLLTQAVGRAGRGDQPGLAVIQTYQPDHPAIQAVVRGDATAFYDAELANRERFGAPPFGRYVKLTVGLPDAAAAERAAREKADQLRQRARERGLRVEVIGPAPAYIARRAGRWRWNVTLRGADPVALLDGGVDAPWSADVDPESLL